MNLYLLRPYIKCQTGLFLIYCDAPLQPAPVSEPMVSVFVEGLQVAELFTATWHTVGRLFIIYHAHAAPISNYLANNAKLELVAKTGVLTGWLAS